MIYIAHYQKYALREVVAVRGLRDHNVEQLDCEDILVHCREVPENGDFSVYILSTIKRLKGVLDVFYGHNLLPRILAPRFHNLPESSLSLDLQDVVFGRDAVPGGGKGAATLFS